MKLTKYDNAFSKYIRLRDADSNGLVRCCSCGKVQHWKDVDCGHFVNRKHMSLRFSEINCNAQCRYCNRFDEGNLLGYAKFIEEKHGREMLDKLRIAKNKNLKYSKFELDVMLEYWKSEINKMKTQKNHDKLR